MARSLASSIAANLALLALATASLSAEQSNSLRARGEAPPASHIDANQLDNQIGDGIEMEEPLWQVQVYSTYQFKPEEIAEDKALPRTHPDKLFLDELAPWEREHRCGGVHIGDMWILTAAHCISKIRPVSDVLTLRRIRVGTTELDQDPGATYRVERAVIHSHYSGLQGHQLHDIALLKIVADAGTNPEAAAKLKQIRILGDLPGDRPLANFDTVWASGWGLVDVRQYGALPLKANGDLMHGSPFLLKVDLHNYAQSRCTDIPELQSFSGPGVICAGSSEPGKDACQGDSGGPLVRIDGPDDEHAVLVGLVSTGKGCGLPGVPGIYTNVPNFRTWIANAKNAPAGQVSRR